MIRPPTSWYSKKGTRRFPTTVFKTKSKQYLMIASHQTVSTEYRYLSADDPDGEFSVFLPRERFHEYDVDHARDAFYIRTNWQAKNFRLMKTPLRQTDRSSWQEVLPYRDDVLLESFELFRDFLVTEERYQGLVRFRIIPAKEDCEHDVDFGNPRMRRCWGTIMISMHPPCDTNTLP